MRRRELEDQRDIELQRAGEQEERALAARLEGYLCSERAAQHRKRADDLQKKLEELNEQNG